MGAVDGVVRRALSKGCSPMEPFLCWVLLTSFLLRVFNSQFTESLESPYVDFLVFLNFSSFFSKICVWGFLFQLQYLSFLWVSILYKWSWVRMNVYQNSLICFGLLNELYLFGAVPGALARCRRTPLVASEFGFGSGVGRRKENEYEIDAR